VTDRLEPAGGIATAEERPKAQPVAWKLLLIPAVLQLLLHLFTNGRFGIFRDEYYYIACAERPAWGYVDHPPFSIWILAVWQSVFGDSLQAMRVLPALCGSGALLLTGATAAQLGGGRWAQMFGGVSVGIGAFLLVVTGFYSMNCFDILFWLGAYYSLIRIVRTGDGKGWIWFGAVLGLGLFNKIGLLVFGVALVIGLAATRHRRHFADKRLYLAGAIALAFLAPYAAWNVVHGWPTLEFIDNAKSGKIVAFTPLEFFKVIMLEANPLTFPIWMGGLILLFFSNKARQFRLIALMFVATFVILNLQKSKPYYFSASVPVMLAAGGVAWERWTSTRRWSWVRWVVLLYLIAGGALIAPMAVPLLSPDRTLAHGRRLGIEMAAQETGHTSALPQHFADRFGWENLARVVSEVYLGLPEEERERCIVLGQNYGHAGALEYWSRKYPLPPVYSTHNNYWFWGPPPKDADVVIVITGNPEGLRELFGDVIEADIASTPGAIESSMTIWICRQPRISFEDIWTRRKSFG
jgi:4-amino-4-deoxy-L-arabinose transferase-like glycosyltransferase